MLCPGIELDKSQNNNDETNNRSVSELLVVALS